MENSNRSGGKLRKNSIGFWGVVFYAVSVIFPAGAFAVTGVTAMTYGGETAPLAFLIGGITLFLAIIAIYFFSQYIDNAGGYYKYVEAGTQNKYLSKSVGFWNAFWVIGDMIAASIVVGWFTWVGLSTLLNITVPLYGVVLLSLIVPVLYLLVGYFGIKVASGTAITIGVLQLVIFTGLAIAFVTKAHYNSIAYFNVGNSLDGLHGFFLAMVVGAFLAYGGYGSVVSLGEEAKLSKQTLKKSIITALLIMVAFDTFVVYSIVAASGPNLSVVDGQFAPGLYIAQQFYGLDIALFAFIFVVLAQIFSPVIFGNSGARTVFSLARDGLLPQSFAKVHKKYGSPYVATIWIFIIVVIGVFLTLIPMVKYYGESNGLFYSFAMWGTAITIFTLLYHIATNSSLAFFIRRSQMKIRALAYVVGPAVASIIMAVAIYYSLLGLTLPLSLVYVLIPIWIIISVILIYIKRKSTTVETVAELTGGK
ncbi:MAG: APC family permease [Candidatus Thermoplasmatota archaeon]|jgi:amino acid transporter|nr:APC family permease [Candidatus Thermoplasmatota archaeon]MCL5732590.1 APC family permease [Candidatus Thermoplasmatota archaeon]